MISWCSGQGQDRALSHVEYPVLIKEGTEMAVIVGTLLTAIRLYAVLEGGFLIVILSSMDTEHFQIPLNTC